MRKLSCLMAFFLLACTGYGQRAKGVAVRLDSFLLHTMQNEYIPGLSVAVMRGDSLVYAKGFGYCNLEHRVPATAETEYNIASVTKSFTAMAVMLLAEEHRVGLNDAIGKYLPGLPTPWQRITVRQLLNHTSGISSFSKHARIPCPVGKDVREYVRGDAWKEVACLPLDFAPGEDWAYGDTGYYLLGLLIEQVTGLRYEDMLQQRIFTPLGMTRSRLVSYTDLIAGRAEGYSYRNGTYQLAPRFDVDEFANGGLVSNVLDMVRLHTALRSETLLKKSSWEQMWTPARLNNGKVAANYGLGFGLTPFDDRKRVGHNGGGGMGFSTALVHFPAEALTLVILTNVNLPDGRIGALANTVASFYFE